MTTAEVAAFEAQPFHAAAVRVRKRDDAGKVAGMKTKSFKDYAGLLQRIVDAGVGEGK